MRRTAIRSPGPKFDYKLAWMRAPRRACRRALRGRRAGRARRRLQRRADRADIYPTKSYANERAAAAAEPRALFGRLLEQGWIDAIRTLHPDEPMYTFWDYMRNRWPRDAGLRIDHLLLSTERRGAPGRGRRRPRRARQARTPATTRRPGSCCDDAAKRAAASTAGGQTATSAAKAHRAATRRRRSRRRTPAAAGDRRRFLRAPLLSRAAEDDPAARRQAGAAPSSASPICCCGSTRAKQPRAVLVALGHAGGADLSARGVSRPIRAAANSTTR